MQGFLSLPCYMVFLPISFARTKLNRATNAKQVRHLVHSAMSCLYTWLIIKSEKRQCVTVFMTFCLTVHCILMLAFLDA